MTDEYRLEVARPVPSRRETTILKEVIVERVLRPRRKAGVRTFTSHAVPRLARRHRPQVTVPATKF